MTIPEQIFRTVWRWGSPADRFYGHMVLKPGGEIYGYSHPNEHRWSYSEGILCFHDQSGAVSRSLRYYSDANCFLGAAEGKKWPFCLMPVIVNSAPEKSLGEVLPPVVINTMPKSGTYLLEAAFRDAGWFPSRVHMASYAQDDYRGLADDAVHRVPADSRIDCPADVFASTLPCGVFAVGHIGEADMVSKIRALDVPVISCVRNLRDVIVSTWRFKLKKVAPVDLQDALWRNASGNQSLDLFILTYIERDIGFCGNIAKMMMADESAVMLRYEEIVQGVLPANFGSLGRLSEYAENITEKLLSQVGKSNPTYSGERSDWRKYWTPFTEHCFRESGLLEVNQALGYE